MRRLLYLLVVLAAGASASVAQAEPPQNVNPRSASGDPVVVVGSEVITDRFRVIGDPLSFAAMGSYQRHIVDIGLDVNITAAIDCLNVVGHVAYMSGTLTESNRADIPVGTPFFTAVADISPDGTGDMTGPAYVFVGAPTCDAGALPPPEFVIASGNITVRSQTPPV